VIVSFTPSIGVDWVLKPPVEATSRKMAPEMVSGVGRTSTPAG
jgi:hypothetical protein